MPRTPGIPDSELVTENATEDRNVQRTILRLLPNWGKGPMQLSVLLGALSIPLRTEAIAALDSLAVVTGQMEARLLDTLAQSRGGDWNFIQVRAMPNLYGRDPRLLQFLAEFV